MLISRKTRTIRLPIHVVKELSVYLRASRELSQKLDHEPSFQEIADLLDRPVEDVERLMTLNDHISSVDTPMSQESEKFMLETVGDASQSDPCNSLQEDDLMQNLDEWLDELSIKHREVLTRRFGLRGHSVGTLEDVGKEIGLTRERVRQIQVEGPARLREIMQSQGLSAENVLS